MIKVDGERIQMSINSDIAAVLARSCGVGEPLHVLAVPDNSRKTEESAHAEYKVEAFADGDNLAFEHADVDFSSTTISGEVSAVHYTRHGQSNGVILDGGEFIHLGPTGLARCALEVGDKADAAGEMGMPILGNRMLEAHNVNGLKLD